MKIISFDSSKKGITKNAFLAFVFQFIIKFKGIIILPLIVNFLPKAILGEWRLISTSTAILLPIITLNILDGSGMFFSGDTEKRKVRIKYYTVFNFSLIITTIFILASLFFKSYIKIFDDYTLALVLYFISLVFAKLSRFLYQTYQKSQTLLTINLIVEYGGAVLTLALILLGVRNIYSLLVPMIVLNLLVSFALFPKINKEIKYAFYFNKKFIKKVLPISVPLIPVYVAEWLLSSIGIYFLQIYFGTEVVGSYSVLLSIASLMLTLRATLQFFWFSTCSNLLQNNMQNEFQLILTETLKVYFSFSLFAIIVYKFFGADLVNILANENFYNVIKPLYFTAFGYVFLVFSTIWNGILYALGQSKSIFRSYLITAVAIIVLSALLVKKFEIMGASIAYMLGNIILFSTMFFSVKGISFGFSKKDNVINSIFVVLIIAVSLLHLFSINQFYNRILGLVLLALIAFVIIGSGYIKPLNVLKIFKK